MSRAYVVYFETPRVHFGDWPLVKARIEALCREYGLDPRLPTDDAFYGKSGGREISHRIARRNMSALDDAEALIVDLNPFRGPSIATRAAWAIGNASARGLPVHGYLHCPESYFERYRRHVNDARSFARALAARQSGEIIGPDNGIVDTFGVFDTPVVAETVSEQHESIATAIEAVAHHFHG